MNKIYLARHGQDQDNAQGILNGHRDMPLTEIGLQQATQVSEKIKDSGITFHKIYSSPLQRAYETARKISQTLNMEEPEKLELLIERDFGIMTGKNQGDIEKICAPHIFKTHTINYFLSPEGAETFPQLILRASGLLKHIETQHSHENILLVTHGDFGKMLYASYYDVEWRHVLQSFHFGNSELLLLSKDSHANDSHVFTIEQFNS